MMGSDLTVTNRILTWPLLVVTCLLFLANVKDFGGGAQLVALSLLSITAAISLLLGRVRRIQFGLNEWILLGIAFISSLSSTLNNLPYSMQYSSVFVVCVIATVILSRSLSFQTAFEITVLGFAIMVCISIIVDPINYFIGLSAQSLNGVGLLRYTQFNLHPNLAGFIFGGGTILLWIRALQTRRTIRIFFFVCSLLSFSLVLAASSRAGMLATVGAFTITGLTRLFPLSRRNAMLLGTAFVGTILAIIFTDLDLKFIDYVVRITDMESDTRGVSSGGSGRTELWFRGLDLVASRDYLQVSFGTGLRSAEIDTIGFSTENSFITVLLEAGLIPGGIALMVLLISAPVYLLRSRNGSIDNLIIGMMLIFALIESIFNRYLLAIGNPLSLYYIFIYCTLMRRKINNE